MKRRVARDHRNKRVLRSLSARYNFHHDALSVLCDASFLRRVLQLADSPGPAGGAAEEPFLFLQRLTVETLDVLDRHSSGRITTAAAAAAAAESREGPSGRQQAGWHSRSPAPSRDAVLRGSGAKESQLAKQLHRIRFVYLPATRRVLEKMATEPAAAEEKNRPTEGGTTKRRASERWRAAAGEERPIRPAAVSQLLRRLTPYAVPVTTRREGEGEDPATTTPPPKDRAPLPPFLLPEANEAKAIGGFMSYHHHQRLLEGQTLGSSRTSGAPLPPPPPQQQQRMSFYFVATQSGKVRRRLPRETALLRLTALPTAMWVEINEEGEGDESKAGKGRGDSRSSVRKRSEGAGGGGGEERTPQGRKGLSAADAAFIAYLGVGGRHANKATTAPIKPGGGRPAGAEASPSPSTPPAAGASPGGKGSGGAPRQKKRAASAQPNPLSVKKKQKREVIRLS